MTNLYKQFGADITKDHIGDFKNPKISFIKTQRHWCKETSAFFVEKIDDIEMIE